MDWPLLAQLEPQTRAEFLALARRRSFERNEVICHAGDPADSLHFVEAGHLAVRGGLASGATATFNILGPGDYFGELSLLREDHRRTATVVALERSRTLSVAGTAFHALCAMNPQIDRVLSTLLAERVEALSTRLLETMYDSLERRVFRRLVALAAVYGSTDSLGAAPETDPCSPADVSATVLSLLGIEPTREVRTPSGRPVIPLSQAQIADLVGATRPSVNQVLQRLVEQRLVSVGRSRLEILDLATLTHRARQGTGSGAQS